MFLNLHESFLIPGTRPERIFEELKKVPKHDILKSFGFPYHKAQNSSKRFRTLLQLYHSFRTLYIEQTKNSKEFNRFFKFCLKMILSNTEIILN